MKLQQKLERALPRPLRWMWRRMRGLPPPVGGVKFGSLRGLAPVSRDYGYDRGLPIDRHYIEAFLSRHAPDVRARALEIGSNDYTLRYGGNRVQQSDVLHVQDGNPRATFVADLAKGENLPSSAFDCIILTQTLHLIYDVRAALATLHRILCPQGVLLMTIPGTISQIEGGTWASTWHWGFTPLSMRKLCEEHFLASDLDIQVFGNVLTSVAFLEGIAAEELHPKELAFQDPLYPLLITVRAQKTSPIAPDTGVPAWRSSSS